MRNAPALGINHRSLVQIIGAVLIVALVATAYNSTGMGVAGAQAGGPVILMGLDSEMDPSDQSHGTRAEHAAMVQSILNNVTNGGQGILVIGAQGAIQEYWTNVGIDVGQVVNFATGPIDIAAADFNGLAMIGVASSDIQLRGVGGLTNEENEALIGRADDIADFVNRGGGLLGKTQDGLALPWGYIDPLGQFQTRSDSYDSVTVTPAGLAMGLTQEGMDNWCCYHETFPQFPDFLEVLIFNRDSASPGFQEAAALGGARVVITQGITLAPAAAENPVDASHTVTATVVDSQRQPVEGAEVSFQVVDGPNATQASPGDGDCVPNADCTTNDNGQASWTYTSNGDPGTDTIQACFTDDQEQELCVTATKVWTEVVVELNLMTGVGHLRDEDGRLVSFDVRLQCDAADGLNSFQVNWGEAADRHSFDLEELTRTRCIDDPNVDPSPPPAGFDTHEGFGEGSYNGEPGATAWWRLTDAGEAGRNDIVVLTITDANDNVVLEVAGNPEDGNLEARGVEEAEDEDNGEDDQENNGQ